MDLSKETINKIIERVFSWEDCYPYCKNAGKCADCDEETNLFIATDNAIEEIIGLINEV